MVVFGFFGTKHQPIKPATTDEPSPPNGRQSLSLNEEGSPTHHHHHHHHHSHGDLQSNSNVQYDPIATIEEGGGGTHVFQTDLEAVGSVRNGSFPRTVFEQHATHINGIEVPAGMQNAQFIVNTIVKKPPNKYKVIAGCICFCCCVGVVVALLISLVFTVINSGSGWYTVAIYSDSNCREPQVEIAYPTNQCISLYNMTDGTNSIKFITTKKNKHIVKNKYIDEFCSGAPAVDTGIDGTGHDCELNPRTNINYIRVFLKQNDWSSIFGDRPVFSDNGFSPYPFPDIGSSSHVESNSHGRISLEDTPGKQITKLPFYFFLKFRLFIFIRLLEFSHPTTPDIRLLYSH
jgi:hypothetical protein